MDVKAFLDWEKANLTQGNPRDSGVVVGYIASFLVAHVLDKAVPMLLPGITVTTSPTDYSVINRFQIQHFESGRWVPVGKTISGE